MRKKRKNREKVKEKKDREKKSISYREQKFVELIYVLHLLQVGVALLCGILFFMLIGFEKMCDCVKDKLVSVFGKEKILEPEDPAALVGTFKRYK